MLTVVCVLVKGPYTYTVDYVVRLHRMARQYLRRPFEFVCLTDQPEIVINADESIGVVRIPSFAGVVPENGVGYWSKVRLFDPLLGFHGRVLYIDLDTLLVAPLDPIVDFPADFALTEDALVVERAHLDRDRYGRRLVRRFNSSVMVWNGGEQTDVWTRWSPAVAHRLSTDQDWIGEQAEAAVGMPLDWFPRISRVQPPWPAEAKVVLVKKPKNHVAADRWPWFAPLWGAA
jgi:hypothetical protein